MAVLPIWRNLKDAVCGQVVVMKAMGAVSGARRPLNLLYFNVGLA